MISQLCRSWGRASGTYLASSSLTKEVLAPFSFLFRGESTSASRGPPVPPSESVPSVPAPESVSSPHPAKITAKFYYAPKYCNKDDVMRFFASCNLKEDDLYLMYDSRFRPKYWVLELDNQEAYKEAMLRTSKMFGGRTVKLERVYGPIKAEEEGGSSGRTTTSLHDPPGGAWDDVERRPVKFSGRSLLIQNLPDDVSTETIENFFSGYLLSNEPMKLFRFIHSNVRTPVVKKLKGEFREHLPQAAELRALVRFESALEARRAQREKHGQYCGPLKADLRFIH